MNQESPRLNSERLGGCFLVKQVNSGELHQTDARQERDMRELNTTSTAARTSSENFCNHISIIQSHYAWKMYSNYRGMKLEPALGTWEDKIKHLSSYAHVVHTTAKQVMSRRRKNENVFKMSEDEKCPCKACKNTAFHCQICKFVGFLLPSSSWLLKLPIYPIQKKLIN